jgi:hypothetical protein
MPKASKAAGSYQDGAISAKPENIIIVGSTRSIAEDLSTVALTQQDLRELMLLDGGDLTEYLASASIGTIETQYVVFIDGKVAGGKEVLAGIPIQSILSIKLMEGVDAVLMGAPPGVSAILVSLDNNLTVHKLQSKVSYLEANYDAEFVYRVSKRKPAASWFSEFVAGENQSNERVSWLGEIEFPTLEIGDITVSLALDRSKVTERVLWSDVNPKDDVISGLTQDATLRWRRYFSPVGWALIGNASQLNFASITGESRAAEDLQSLLASGPILPWGPEAVFLTLSTRIANRIQTSGNSTVHKTIVRDFVGFSIPLSRIWEGSSDNRSARTSVSLSRSRIKGGSASKADILAELVYVKDKRLRTSIGWQLSEPTAEIGETENCYAESASSDRSSGEIDFIRCMNGLSRLKNSSMWGDIYLSPSPRGPWSASFRWKRTTFSASHSLTEPVSQVMLFQDAYSIRLRLFGNFSNDSALAIGKPHNRWDASLGLTMEKSPRNKGVDPNSARTTGALQARFVLRGLAIGVNGRIVQDHGISAVRSGLASFGAYIDLPLSNFSDASQQTAVWRDGPRLRAEILERHSKGMPPETILSLRLTKSF